MAPVVILFTSSGLKQQKVDANYSCNSDSFEIVLNRFGFRLDAIGRAVGANFLTL